MHSRTLPILYPALRWLIVNRLQKSLDWREFQCRVAKGFEQAATSLSQSQSLGGQHSEFQAIPLNRIKLANELEYVSALAFKLQSLQAQPALLLAQKIAANLALPTWFEPSSPANLWTERIWQHVVISVRPPGWIHLRLKHAGVAEWLQGLASDFGGWGVRS